MTRRTSYLSPDRLDLLASMLKLFGYTVEPCQGEYEVLRARRDNFPLLIVYRRERAPHLTVSGNGDAMVDHWIIDHG